MSRQFEVIGGDVMGYEKEEDVSGDVMGYGGYQGNAQVVGYEGRLRFDSSKPDGTPRKLLDCTRLRNMGWQPTVTLRDGIARSYADFLARAAAGTGLSH